MDDFATSIQQLSLFEDVQKKEIAVPPLTDLPKEKKQKREKEKQLLLYRLAAGDTTHLITKVAHVLNRYPSTRNSDITLQLRYWETYQPDLFSDGKFEPENLYHFEKLTSLARARAKIQNEFGLFRADKKIRRFRKSREEIQREIQIATKPDIPTLTINCDESGKSGKGSYLIVGSVWLLDRSREWELRDYFQTWKIKRGFGIKNEFHFTEMRKHDLKLYKDFFGEVVNKSDMMSFKAIVIDKRNLERSRATDEVISELHYQLVHQGIQHEVESNRISLPRYVDFWKDAEKGVDALTLTKIEQNLQLQFKVNYDDQLKLSLFDAVESHWSVFVQIADLFTGCINRILNEGGSNNHKDEFTKYALSLLGIDPENILGSDNDDIAKIIEIK